MGLLKRIDTLQLTTKMALLGLLALVLFAIPTYLAQQTLQAGIAVAQLERDGMAPMRDLLGAVKVMQEHRGLSARVLGGDAAAASARSAKPVPPLPPASPVVRWKKSGRTSSQTGRCSRVRWAQEASARPMPSAAILNWWQPASICSI